MMSEKRDRTASLVFQRMSAEARGLQITLQLYSKRLRGNLGV